MKKLPVLIAICAFAAGCSTLPRSSTTVVEKADGVSCPDWASITNPMTEDQGHRYFLGYIEVDGDASKSAALNMADEKALSEPFRALVDQFMDQNQVGEELKGSTGQRIISATRGYRPSMPDLRISRRYWEVAETHDANGGVRMQLRAYALAEVSKADFEKAKQRYFSHLSGDLDVKKVLDEIGASQRAKILDSAKSE